MAIKRRSLLLGSAAVLSSITTARAQMISICGGPIFGSLFTSSASAQAIVPNTSVLCAGGVFASIDMDFQHGNYAGLNPSQLTVSRASTGTDLLPSSASGYAYNTYGNNVARISPVAGGLIVEESRTNSLLNSAAPITQTTGSLGTGTYTLWVNGAGTATPSGGTATITGAAAASNGSPNTFTVTVAGTVVVTVAGALKLELGTWGTSGIVTTGAAATRAADNISAAVSGFGAALTLFYAGTPLAPAAYGTNQFFLELTDGTLNNRFGMLRSAGSGVGQFTNSVGNVGQGLPSNTAVITTGSLSKIAYAGASGASAASLNGATALTATPGAVPTAVISAARIGQRGDSGNIFYNGIISRIAIWPNTALSAAQLQSITT